MARETITVSGIEFGRSDLPTMDDEDLSTTYTDYRSAYNALNELTHFDPEVDSMDKEPYTEPTVEWHLAMVDANMGMAYHGRALSVSSRALHRQCSLINYYVAAMLPSTSELI